MARRIEQVNSFMQEELNNLILTELEFAKNCLVTITKVIVSKDLSLARVYISILPISLQASVFKKLNLASGHLRHLLSRKFHAFRIPKLEFVYDDMLLKHRLVEREIEEIHQIEGNK